MSPVRSWRAKGPPPQQQQQQHHRPPPPRLLVLPSCHTHHNHTSRWLALASCLLLLVLLAPLVSCQQQQQQQQQQQHAVFGGGALLSSSVCPPPLVPCESRSFFTNITVQVDFESPRQGAVLGTECRVKLGLVLHGSERPLFEEMQADVSICLRLDGGPRECRPLSQAQSFRLSQLSPGPHCLSAWAQDRYNRRIGYGLDSTTEFSVLDVAQVLRARQQQQASGGSHPPHTLELVAPDNRTAVRAGMEVVTVSVEGTLACSPCPSSWQPRLYLDLLDASSSPPTYHASFDSPLIVIPRGGRDGEGETHIRASLHVPLAGLPPGPGFFTVRASVIDPIQPPLPEEGQQQPSPRMVTSAPLLLYRQASPPPSPPSPSPLVVVTAADEPYLGRLENLVGSLHVWAPDVPIVVYDLGLTTFTRDTVSGWANVQVRSLPWSTLPKHFRQASLCAFKAYVVLHALQRGHRRVIWLDANFELRRPLDAITSLMDAAAADDISGGGPPSSSFLTISGHLFPTDKVVRPSTLHALGCRRAPFASRLEATSAVMGVDQGSVMATHILPAMHRCALDLEGCHFPTPDHATLENQRRDQSALNAALCALEEGNLLPPIHNSSSSKQGVSLKPPLVYPDKRFWMWADQSTYLPTTDPEAFSDMVLFSRRGKPPNPYVRYVQKKAIMVVEEGDQDEEGGPAVIA